MAQAVIYMEDHMRNCTRIETVVVGGGQTGLSMGYHLAKQGRPFLILDANERVGHAWRNRWDSLRLFTPAKFNGLAGMKFPTTNGAVVTKDQMADFLEAYADRFELPIHGSSRVSRLTREGEEYHLRVGDRLYVAKNVIVAMANYQKAFTPKFSAQLLPAITQVHSSEYRNTDQLQEGGVLIVGAGNSGADIAMDVAKNHATWMAGNDVGEIPFRIETHFALRIGIPLVRFVGHHILSVKTPIGRRLRPKFLKTASPRVRVKMKDLVGAGVQCVPRVAKIEDGQPVLEDGRVLDVANVIWCTGYTTGFKDWIDLPIFADGDAPDHERGVVKDHPGLYFAGLNFQTSATSDTVTGGQRDVRYVARQVRKRMRRVPEVATPAARAYLGG